MDSYLENTKYKSKTEKDSQREAHLQFSNIVNNDWVPGIFININDYAEKVDENILEGSLDYPLLNNDVIFFNEDLANTFECNTSELTTLTEEQMFKMIYYINFGFYEYNNDYLIFYELAEFKDAEGNTVYHTQATDGTIYEFDDQITAYTDIIANKNTIFFKDDPEYPKPIKYIEFCSFGWLADQVRYFDIPLTIPIKDFGAFRSMDKFEKCFGDIVLKLMFGPRSMVWTYMEEHESNYHKLMQMNDDDRMMSLSVDSFEVTHLSCDCFGYNIDEKELAEISTKFINRSRIYETRFTEFTTFNGSIINGKIDIDTSYDLNMVKEIHVTFPRQKYQTTVFRNPLLKNVRLKIDNELFPKGNPYDTDDIRFKMIQITETDRDEDYRYSYLKPIISDRALNPILDDSNFIITWKLGEVPFSGLNIGKVIFEIELIAERKYKIINIYSLGNKLQEKEEPSPQIWLTKDAFWNVDTNYGLIFCNDALPIHELNIKDADIHYIK